MITKKLGLEKDQDGEDPSQPVLSQSEKQEAELKNKQDKKIAALEQEISKYRDDCSSIMKYC